MELATVCAYVLPDGARIELTSKPDDDPKWAVRTMGGCLNKMGHIEYEPQPSSRDAGFLDRCRFDSAKEAYQAWERPAQPF